MGFNTIQIACYFCILTMYLTIEQTNNCFPSEKKTNNMMAGRWNNTILSCGRSFSHGHRRRRAVSFRLCLIQEEFLGIFGQRSIRASLENRNTLFLVIFGQGQLELRWQPVT